ncbi:hypothetical protein FOCC_FOCC002263 [Frankliniella occidentalis]|nr:hypothetical protein FOCC_FOCC002263 [Frankliniella occidentalis]
MRGPLPQQPGLLPLRVPRRPAPGGGRLVLPGCGRVLGRLDSQSVPRGVRQHAWVVHVSGGGLHYQGAGGRDQPPTGEGQTRPAPGRRRRRG